jgi:hypothetical protein
MRFCILRRPLAACHHKQCGRSEAVAATAGRGAVEPLNFQSLGYLPRLLSQMQAPLHNHTCKPLLHDYNSGSDAAPASIEMPPYHYSPLRKDRDEFRLLSLLPGTAEAEIEIELFVAPRSSQYEALSYVWGLPERTDVVLVRNPVEQPPDLPHEDPKLPTTIGITHNLSVALRHFRSSNKPRILWIDAICINQDDLAERSTEVLEMESIYSRAKQVIVWLGPSSTDSALAIETMGRLGDGMTFDSGSGKFSIRAGSLADLLDNEFEPLKSLRPAWFAIKDLLNRQWFSRLWVYQEIALASTATVVIGHHSVDWTHFATALEWLWTRLDQLNQLFPNLEIEDFVTSSMHDFLLVSTRKRPRGYKFGDLLATSSKLHCFDPRDRLISIRALVTPDLRHLIIPDYSSSVEEAFKQFTSRHFKATGAGFLLTRCLLRDATATRPMPSWVPDFSMANLPSQLRHFPSSGRSSFNIAINEVNLHVHAVKLASITSLVVPLNPSSTNLELVDVCRSWLGSFPSAVYPGGGTTSDAFIDAILCAQRAELAPPHYGLCLNLEQCRSILKSGEAGFESEDTKALVPLFSRVVRRWLRGRVLFKTGEGFLGLCPESAKPGDVVAVVLGVDSPLILRPVTHQGKYCYLVVGAAYVPGAMHAEVLLGPIPAGWILSYKRINGYLRQIFNDGNIETQQDPRLPLPLEWRYIYESGESFQEMERSPSGDILTQWFGNVETKEKSWYDPRLTPEVLREREVDVQELVLI